MPAERPHPRPRSLFLRVVRLVLLVLLIGSVLNITTAAAMWYCWRNPQGGKSARTVKDMMLEEGPLTITPPPMALVADPTFGPLPKQEAERRTGGRWALYDAGEWWEWGWSRELQESGPIAGGGVGYWQESARMRDPDQPRTSPIWVMSLRSWDFGWPFHSVRGSTIETMCGVQPPKWGKAWRRLPWGWSKGERPIPCVPLWRGLALNTLILGVVGTPIWLGFVAIASAVRRRLRRARNVCPRCGYSREGLPGPDFPCPECGHAMKASTQSREDAKVVQKPVV